MISSLGIKYSVRDLIYEVNYSYRPTKLRYGSQSVIDASASFSFQVSLTNYESTQEFYLSICTYSIHIAISCTVIDDVIN